ncbi:MAG: cytochrome c biogenesis protein CcdA [Chloroflexi bacterium]|nr:cytochrome c biogenesis protein CcdA [Chloroflexota bacterium]
MKIGRLPHRLTLDLSAIRVAAALLSLGSAAIHLAFAPEHFSEWWGYGWFFLVVAAFQALYGVGLMAPRGRLFTAPWYLTTGISLNLWVAGLYAVTRTVGVPLLGPHAGHLEGIGVIDILSKVLELGTVASLSALLFWRTESKSVLARRLRLSGMAFLGIAATLALLWAMARVQDEQPEAPFSSTTLEAGQAPAVGAESPALPTIQELLPQLVRGGWGPRGTAADVLYAPPVFFQVKGEEVPAASLERPTLVFFLEEADHEHDVGLAPEPPQPRLRIDGGDSIEPYQVSVLLWDGIEHRTSQVLFPLPEGMGQETLDQGEHTLTFGIPLEDGVESTFTWRLPLDGVAQPAAATQPSVPEVSASSQALTRTVAEVEYAGARGIRVESLFATPDYFATSLPADAASRYDPERFTFFVVTERLHTADLPADSVPISLALNGRTYQPDLSEQIAGSAHHRVTLVRFPVEPPLGPRHQVMELSVAGGQEMVWHLPIVGTATTAPAKTGVRFVWTSVLAIMGGMIAAMWPCLFQLTVFFIPSLGGLSMQEASGNVSVRRRVPVVKAAIFFVLGFTLLYTAAGALIGFAAGRLGSAPNFEVWQRYLGIGAGVIIILLALRVAAKVRAPLVCKMPVLSKMAHSRRVARPWEMMFAGVAFATGCMTCFGAAVVVAMVVYVGLAGSAALGALTLFLFSMGMGIPLVIAATAMARVMPLLMRLEKVIPWMGLASSLVMVGFAILLITGNYMALTQWLYRTIPGLSLP